MELTDIIKEENLVLQKSKLLTDNVMHYCPGCTHGVVHKLIAEVIEELNSQDQTIGVSPVGCSRSRPCTCRSYRHQPPAPRKICIYLSGRR